MLFQGITAFVVGSPAALTRGWVRNNSKTVNHEKQDTLTGMKRSYTPLRDYHINIVNLIDYWKCKQRYIQNDGRTGGIEPPPLTNRKIDYGTKFAIFYKWLFRRSTFYPVELHASFSLFLVRQISHVLRNGAQPELLRINGQIILLSHSLLYRAISVKLIFSFLTIVPSSLPLFYTGHSTSLRQNHIAVLRAGHRSLALRLLHCLLDISKLCKYVKERCNKPKS